MKISKYHWGGEWQQQGHFWVIFNILLTNRSQSLNREQKGREKIGRPLLFLHTFFKFFQEYWMYFLSCSLWKEKCSKCCFIQKRQTQEDLYLFRLYPSCQKSQKETFNRWTVRRVSISQTTLPFSKHIWGLNYYIIVGVSIHFYYWIL